MKLNSYFSLFHQKINLDESRSERIKSAHQTLRSTLEKDEVLKEILNETFLQGSYRIGTAIKPTKGNEFDVDVVISLDFTDENGARFNPRDAISHIYDTLKSKKLYQDKLIRKTRCVCIDYSGDFHMDVVPAHQDQWNETLYIPDRTLDNWRETNPKGFIQWCADQNKNYNGKFTRVVKFLKWWRNYKFGQESAIKSIILTTLIGNHFSSNYNTDADSLLGTVDKLHGFLKNRPTVPSISNPSVLTEDLARNWKHSHYDTFRNRVSTLLDQINEAYEEEDIEKSIEKWKKIFGDQFPSSLEIGAQKVKEAHLKQEVMVGSSGQIILNDDEIIDAYKIPRQRFYGSK